HEGPGGRATRDRLHHRRLDLEEAPRVEELTDRLDEPASEQEDRAARRVDDEVDVPAPIARLHVLEAVPLLGQRPERLSEEGEALDGDRQLARPRPEHVAGHADKIAEVDVGEVREVVAELVRPRVELDPARVVLEVGEARLAVVPHGHDPSRDADGAEALQLVLARAPEPRGQRPGPMRDRVARAERVDAALAQGLELLPTVLEQLAAGRLLAHSARPWAHRR